MTTRFKTMAENLRNARLALRNVANEGVYISEAIDEIRTASTDTADDALNMYLRYNGAANALSQYAASLETLQSKASSARMQLANAIDDARTAMVNRDYYEDLARQPGGDSSEYIRLVQHYQGAYEAALGAQASARAQYEQAETDRDAAAQLAIDRIELAFDHSGLDDTFLDNVEGGFKKFQKWAQENLAPLLEALREAAGFLADWLTTIGLVMALIPGLQKIAAFLLTVAGVLSLVALAATLLLFIIGKESLGNVLKEVVKVAVKKLAGVVGKKVMGVLDKAVFAHPMLTGSGVNTKVITYVHDLVETTAPDILNQLFDEIGAGSGAYDFAGASEFVFDLNAPSDPAYADWNVPEPVEIAPLTIPNMPEGLDSGVVSNAVGDRWESVAVPAVRIDASVSMSRVTGPTVGVAA
ncbi:MAG: hypothetical protein RIC81_09270 [Microcella pacifica]|uniref:hypothetical protein n=1 Tax=Microcella pacifica TaxID=2591847 RepID=UPI003314A179